MLGHIIVLLLRVVKRENPALCICYRLFVTPVEIVCFSSNPPEITGNWAVIRVYCLNYPDNAQSETFPVYQIKEIRTCKVDCTTTLFYWD